MKVKTIYIKCSPEKSSTRIEVATYERGKLALQFRGENGVYSKLPRNPAKSLRDAMKQVQRMYGGVCGNHELTYSHTHLKRK